MMAILSQRNKQKIKASIPKQVATRKLTSDHAECVLLTFDDGPHPEITPRVLELLEKYRARALFFIVGHRASEAPQVIERIRDRGHAIGNHTYIHSNDKQPSFFEYWRDLKRCQVLLDKVTGQVPKTFRPPGARISLKSLIIPRLLGMKVVLSSVDAHDWRCRMADEAKKMAEYIIDNIAPGDILVLHDDNPFVLPILEMILPYMKSRKFDLKSAVHHFMGTRIDDI